MQMFRKPVCYWCVLDLLVCVSGGEEREGREAESKSAGISVKPSRISLTVHAASFARVDDSSTGYVFKTRRTGFNAAGLANLRGTGASYWCVLVSLACPERRGERKAESKNTRRKTVASHKHNMQPISPESMVAVLTEPSRYVDNSLRCSRTARWHG